MESLETKRLVFRHYQTSDKQHFIHLFTDKIVMKNVDRGVLPIEQAEQLWTKLFHEMYPKGVDTIFAVFTKDEHYYAGHASIRPRRSKKEDWEIGYILKTECWRKGFATEIAERLIKHGFEKLKLTEIFGTIDDDNFGSIKVAEKAGMNFLRYEFDDHGRFSVFSIKSATDK